MIDLFVGNMPGDLRVMFRVLFSFDMRREEPELIPLFVREFPAHLG
jgi:hypothetical protein